VRTAAARRRLDRAVADVLLEYQPWMTSAACKGKSKLFCSNCDDLQDRAKALCTLCPVISECAAYGIRTRLEGVVFAGTTERDRLRMQRSGEWGRWCARWGAVAEVV
jgi:hypothetical protein